VEGDRKVQNGFDRPVDILNLKKNYLSFFSDPPRTMPATAS
jgi:hypothetical protein